MKAQEQAIRLVVLDAGHGGHDVGNTGTGRYKKSEKDISLDVTLKLGQYIKENYPDIKVLYTRKDDRFIQLNERSNIANRNHADLFISIHCNSAPVPAARGTETFVMGLHKSKDNLDVAMRENSTILMEDNYENTYQDFNPKDPDSYIAMSLMQSAYLDQSLILAAKVQEDFTTRLGRYNRGVKQAGFLVLYKTAMPAILVELGFLTNKDEEDFLHSDNGKDYMASAVFRAFKTYKESVDNMFGNNKTEPPKEKKKDKEERNKIEEIKEELTLDSTELNTNKLYRKPKTDELPAVSQVENQISYTVQVISSEKKLALNSPRFKNVEGVQQRLVNGIYKYSFGSFTNYKQAKAELENIKKKGFISPFIVAYNNNTPIGLNEARKITEKP